MFRSALIALAALCVAALAMPDRPRRRRARHPSSSNAPTTQDEPRTDGDVNECKIVAVICVGKEALDAVTGITGGLIGDGAEAAAGTRDGRRRQLGGRRRGMAGHADRRRRRSLDEARAGQRLVHAQLRVDGPARDRSRGAVPAARGRPGDAAPGHRRSCSARVGALPLALILTFVAVTLVQLGLAVTDWMTARVLESSGDAPDERVPRRWRLRS